MKSARDHEGTQTLQRGLDVLTAFRGDRKPLTNGELVRRTGLSKATVSRLTTTLVQLGFLRRAALGVGFELGTRGLGLGHAFLQGSPLHVTAMPLMQRVADRLNVSVALAMAENIHMLYVAYAPGKRIATLRLGVGSFLPMGLTAVGRAYLYSLAPDSRRAMLARLGQADPRHADAIASGARAAFEDLEASQTCTCIGEFQRDAVGIATPAAIGVHGTPMALSCGAVGLASRLGVAKPRIVPELLALRHELEMAVAKLDTGPVPASALVARPDGI
ncbi:IclR family transcriptional regulator [Cupriavidus nantongensis]|uniref:IclR family transcriptional regulator n=1 Tax=Cupriavidus nantongensis TaxID=1796606 RepID=UPI00358F2D18